MKMYSVIFCFLCLVMLTVFVPILFCIFVWGSEMDYNSACKLVTLRDNGMLLLLGAAVMLLCFLFAHITGKIKMTKKLSCVMDGCLIFIFVIVFFVNVEVCKCLNLAQGWDVSCVVGTAYQLHHEVLIGNDGYYSLYPNNVPITFVLYKLFNLADGMKDFHYVNDFMWVIVICLMISVTGYFMCVSVKKITQNFAITCIACFLYIACVCVTPWKTVPYTDMFAIMFPLLSISLYVFYYYSKNKIVRYILWFLIFVSGFLGSLMKPTVFIVPIAIILCEIVRSVINLRGTWKEILVKLALIVLALFMYCGCKQFIYEDVGYEPNKESEFTALHFLMMGLNEQSTGSFHSGDVAISGNVQLLEDRTEKQIEVIKERLEEKGFFGYINFLLRKMVMTFNDGTFGWGREGVYTLDVYPIYKNFFDATLIKDIFIPNYLYSGQFNTYSQTVWLLIIFCIPGFCFVDKEKREVCMPILVSMLGIILYLMLFEARARYLICFLPVIIMVATLGMKQYYEMLKMIVGYICNKVKTICQSALNNL